MVITLRLPAAIDTNTIFCWLQNSSLNCICNSSVGSRFNFSFAHSVFYSTRNTSHAHISTSNKTAFSFHLAVNANINAINLHSFKAALIWNRRFLNFPSLVNAAKAINSRRNSAAHIAAALGTIFHAASFMIGTSLLFKKISE